MRMAPLNPGARPPAPAQWVPDSSLDGTTEDSSHDGPTNTEKSQETAAAFPTDSKERERDAKNLRKAQGLEAKEKKKKTFAVEDHYDDCGEDLFARPRRPLGRMP